MTPRQRKFAEGWLTVGGLMLLVALLEEHKAVVYAAFAIAAAYLCWNHQFIREQYRLRPFTPVEILRQSLLWKIVAALWSFGVICVSVYVIQSTGSLGEPKFWELFAFIFIPMAGPLIVAELQLYHRLGATDSAEQTLKTDV